MRNRNISFIVILLLELGFILFLAIKKSNHYLPGYLGLVAAILLLIATGWMTLFPKSPVINPTGPYQILVEDITLTDNSRLETYKNDGTKRSVEVKFWYPKNYTEESTCPLVVFSHGSFGTVDNNETLMKELASRGYVSASIGHTYQAFTAKINDEKIGMSSTFRKEMMGLNPEKEKEQAVELFHKWMNLTVHDASFVIDSIKNNNDGFYKLIDKSKICMMGHSLGGSTALGVGRVRDDINCVVALESPFMYDVKGVRDDKFIFDETLYPTKMLNVYSDSSYSKLNKWDQYSQNYKYLNMNNENYSNVYLKGLGHMHLCDFQLLSPFLSWILSGCDSGNSAQENLEMINKTVLNFFTQISFVNKKKDINTSVLLLQN